MKLSLVVILVLFSIFLSEVQGIQLEKGFMSFHELHHHHLKTEIKRSNGGIGEVMICKNGECSGNKRKLVTSTISTTTITSKNEGKTNNLASKKKENEEIGHEEHYQDIVDIAEMDYSPARRKPPIHN